VRQYRRVEEGRISWPIVAIEGAKNGTRNPGRRKELARAGHQADPPGHPAAIFGGGEKIRIVLSGLRGEDSIAELCRREGMCRTSITYYPLVERVFSRLARSASAATRRRAATSDEGEGSAPGGPARLKEVMRIWSGDDIRRQCAVRGRVRQQLSGFCRARDATIDNDRSTNPDARKNSRGSSWTIARGDVMTSRQLIGRKTRDPI